MGERRFARNLKKVLTRFAEVAKNIIFVSMETFGNLFLRIYMLAKLVKCDFHQLG